MSARAARILRDGLEEWAVIEGGKAYPFGDGDGEKYARDVADRANASGSGVKGYAAYRDHNWTEGGVPRVERVITSEYGDSHWAVLEDGRAYPFEDRAMALWAAVQTPEWGTVRSRQYAGYEPGAFTVLVPQHSDGHPF